MFYIPAHHRQSASTLFWVQTHKVFLRSVSLSNNLNHVAIIAKKDGCCFCFFVRFIFINTSVFCNYFHGQTAEKTAILS